jgi:hypothetical protein
VCCSTWKGACVGDAATSMTPRASKQNGAKVLMIAMNGGEASECLDYKSRRQAWQTDDAEGGERRRDASHVR